jgi:hypothetical protein
MILARPEKRTRPALSGLDGTALGTYDKAMELLDRKTVLARVRAQRPTFSLKQLKAVIAANPSLRAQHLPLGRSKFGYPAELVDAAIAYVDSADVKRSGGHRHIMTLFSRSHVPASEYRAMIEPRLAPFLKPSIVRDNRANSTKPSVSIFSNAPRNKNATTRALL